MITKPTEPLPAYRHPYSTRGLSLRVLLLGVMLTSLALAVTGGQPVGASSADGREPASDAAILADGEPAGGVGTSGQSTSGGPAGSGTAIGQDGDAPPDGIVPAASASPGAPSGGSAGSPPNDWHLYHHWTDPSWPDAGQATGAQPEPGDESSRPGVPLPDRTAGVDPWEPPVTATTDPSPAAGWTQTPGDPTDPAPGTPTGLPTTTGPAPDPTRSAPDPTGPDESPDPSTAGAPLPRATTVDPSRRDPVAAGPDDDDLGLGETVDEPTPTPEPTPSAVTAPRQAMEADTTPASKYHQTLIYSGLIGLALAAIGLTMVGLRRRRW